MTSSVGRFGKYTLVRRIAQGGMGEVWLARQQGPGGFTKNVAVKMLLPHLTEDKAFADALLGEAAVTARLTHRNIAQVFDFGLDDETGSYFLTMEFVAGRPLHRLLQESARRGEKMAPALARDLAVQLCEGLSYAHNLRGDDGAPLHLVHRDLNPANVLVSYNGDVKVIDWGIAKSEMSAVRTETGTIKGKFVYMSPEQSSARPVDKRSDIFALGITLYELLTGTNPFQRPNVLLSLEAIQRDEPPAPGAKDPLLAPFDDILARALAKAPDERYADASEMAEALRDLSLPPARERLGAFVLRLFPDQGEVERPEPSDMRRRVGSGPHAFAPEATQRASLSEETQGASARGERTVVESETRRLTSDAGAGTRRTGPGLLWPLVGASTLAAVAIGGWWWSQRDALGPTPVVPVTVRAEPKVPVVPAPVVAPAEPVEPSKVVPAVAETTKTEAPKADMLKGQTAKEPPAKPPRETGAKTEASKGPSTPPEAKPATEAPVVVVTKEPRAEGPGTTVTVSTQERGRLSLRSSPAMAMTIDGRGVSPGVSMPLMHESGVVDVGESTDSLRINGRYRVVEGGVEVTIDSTPWSLVEANANGEPRRTPKVVRLTGPVMNLELKNPKVEQSVRLTIRYDQPPTTANR